MKKLLFILFVCSALNGFGQENLVLNPSFEQVTKQPKNHSELPLAVGWYAPNGSSDIYSRNAKRKDYKIPNNLMGNRDTPYGDVYAGFYSNAGFYASYIKDTRENLQATLIEKLVKGTTYRIEFYYCQSVKSTVDETSLGVAFSNKRIFTFEDHVNFGYQYYLSKKDKL